MEAQQEQAFLMEDFIHMARASFTPLANYINREFLVVTQMILKRLKPLQILWVIPIQNLLLDPIFTIRILYITYMLIYVKLFDYQM